MERKGQGLRLEGFRGCFGENTMEVWRPRRKKMKKTCYENGVSEEIRV